jgi:hypothetical protein
MNQRFEAACCRIYAHLLDGQTLNQLALCKGLQEQAKKERGFNSKFRVGYKSWVCGYDPGTKEQSSQWKSFFCHPRELRQLKSDLKTMSVFLNSEAVLQKEFFLQCQPGNQQFCVGVLRVFMEAVGRKCVTGCIHRTGCCILTTRHATWIHGFFRCLTKRKWWWYLASVLLHTSWLILVLKYRNMVQGMKIRGCHENKAELQATLEHIAKQKFQRCSQLWERHWVMCLNQEGDLFKRDNTKL